MSRLLATLLAASLFLPRASSAQAKSPATTSLPSGTTPPATGSSAGPDSGTGMTPSSGPGAVTRGAAESELDPAVRDIVRREVEKAKEEMRDEIRAEIQGAQSAREFMETSGAGERAKLDFLQLNGYYRVRGDLFDNLDLHRAADPSGYYMYPRPLMDANDRGTLTSANMRFRLEPTLNVSEQVRVLAQIDALDDVLLGSTPQGLYTSAAGVQFPVGTWTEVPPMAGINSDRASISVKRAWAEVQTPVGLLSFGRMPSSWGLGILSNAGNGIDDDFGDSVDRVQFALTPLNTPVGPLVLIPMYEIVSTGVTSIDRAYGMYGIGQPFDRDQADDAKSIGVKIVRMDTDEEIKRKLDRGEASVNFGAWYQYKSQSYQFVGWATSPTIPNAGQPTDAASAALGPAIKRGASAHVLDLWFRRLTKRFRLEAEAVGIIGQIDNVSNDPANPIGPVLLRQFGGNVQGAVKFFDGKLTVGGEFGIASGDTNSGFGNQPGRSSRPVPGDIEGAQYHCDPPGTPGGSCDQVLDIRNYRFNPAYRVDLILWREILQGVTDAWYLKPSARYDLLEGLSASLAVVYSQAMDASSTPSTVHTPLGIEMDVGLTYQSDDGFIVWLNYGLLEPLDGLGYIPGAAVVGRGLSLAHAIRSGVAVKF